MTSHILKAVFTILLMLCAALTPFIIIAKINPPRSNVSLEALKTDGAMYVSDEQLGSRIKPDLSFMTPGPNGDYQVITGARGDRIGLNTEVSSKQADIIVVGGSQTFASGLPADQSFAAQVSEMTGLKTRNFAVPGYGGVSSLLMMKQHLDLKPKFVIYGFWEDHMRRNLARCAAIDSPICFQFPILRKKDQVIDIDYPKDAAKKVSEVRAYYSDTAKEISAHSLILDTYWTIRKWYRRLQDQLIYSDNSNDRTLQIKGMEWVLDRMAKAAAEHDATLIVVYIPLYFYRINTLPTEFETMAENSSVIFIDMSERLMEMRQNGVSFTIPNDGHLNALGHSSIAESIFKVIRETDR